MNSFNLPFLPAALWVIAAGCLILLIIVVFGYHIYQRGRLRALAGDAASIASLVARKETLEADVAEMRQWLSSHKSERLKLEAERRQQELARAEMARLEKRIAERKEEGQAIMTRMAELDIACARRRQFQTKLEAEIRSLEAQREELAPMERYVQELRVEVDQGKMRLAQLAQEEIRAQALQTQAQMLKREIAELRDSLAPLREEREKLRQFVEQARHASAVKNEQLLDQRRKMRSYEQQNAELAKKNGELAADVEDILKRHEEAVSALAEMKNNLAARQREGEDLRNAVFAEQTRLEILMQRREEKETEVAALASRKAAMEQDIEKLAAKTESTPVARRERRRSHARRPRGVAARRISASGKAAKRPELVLAFPNRGKSCG